MWKWIASLGSIQRSSAAIDSQPEERHADRVIGPYAPLHKYLNERYADVVILTIGEIEDILGFALPDHVRTEPQWWTTTDTHAGTVPYSDAWILAGRTARPNLVAQTVTFERH